MKKRLVKLADSWTSAQYSWLQIIGWIILGNMAGWNRPWWEFTLIAVGILSGFIIANDTIRLIAGLPPWNRKSYRSEVKP